MARRLRRVAFGVNIYKRMKKLIVTEAQYKMLQKEGVEYTPEKIDQFVEEAKMVVAKAKELGAQAYNIVAATGIGEIMDDTKKYDELLAKMEGSYEKFDQAHTKYYNIAEMYDYMNLPDNVKELETITSELDNAKEVIYRIYNKFEEILDAAKKIAEYKPEQPAEEVDEQFFKGLKDKVSQIKDKVTQAVKPSKEVTQAGRPPQGRDLDQLKSEWSKINANTSDLRGYGEATGPNLNSIKTAAEMAAKTAIMKKLNRQQASFGVEIKDEAVFQLENGNYIQLIVLEPNNIK